MKSEKIITGGDVCRWKPAKRKRLGISCPSLFRKPQFLLWLIVVAAGASYLFTINQTAVQGFKYRVAEKKVGEFKEENEQLKIREAELKSLYRIEEAGRNMQMIEHQNLSYLEEYDVVAIK